MKFEYGLGMCWDKNSLTWKKRRPVNEKHTVKKKKKHVQYGFLLVKETTYMQEVVNCGDLWVVGMSSFYLYFYLLIFKVRMSCFLITKT